MGMLFTLLVCFLLVSLPSSSGEPIKMDRNIAATRNIESSEIYKVGKIDVGMTSIFASSNIIVKAKVAEQKFYITFSNSTENIEEGSLWWKALLRESRNDVRKKVSPFEDLFFKITPESHSQIELLIHVKDRVFDFKMFAQFLGGIVLFIVGKRLSRSFTFYYTFGASLGVLAVFGGALFILFKLVPYRKSMMGLAMTCTGFLVYLYERLYNNIYHLIMKYPSEVFMVCVVAALVSMAVTYYFGPPTSERTWHLFQCGIQFSALYMIYSSSYNKEFSTTAIALLLVFYFLSHFSIFVRIFVYITPRKLRNWYAYPKERRLLTIEEYEEQGRLETEKALKELADYCNNSPGRYSWRTVSRLQDPRRFAQFLNEGEHFTNEELDAYDKFEVTGQDESYTDADVTDSGFSLRGEELDEYWMTEDESQASTSA